jgi:hypothetical protein
VNDFDYITPVKHWLETFVIELNLCPFAKREYMNGRVRFSVSDAKTEEVLVEHLNQELTRLLNDDTIETTLLIHPHVLTDFATYNDFLDVVDALLMDLDLIGVFQVASFHPDYQFADTQPEDTENYTNRSPYPLLHLIREASLEKAIANFPNPELIPERNIELLNTLGEEKVKNMFASHFPMSEG